MTAVRLGGYYGHGNLGDDLLLRVSHDQFRAVLGADNVGIDVDLGDAYRHGLGLDGPLGRPDPDDPATVHLLGGGGLFFDLRVNPGRGAPAVWAGRRLGGPKLAALRSVAARRHGPPQGPRAAVGIGFGPFTRGSMRELWAASQLGRFRHVAVRDPDSARRLRDWRIPVSPGTDLAFLHAFPAVATGPAAGAAPTMALVARSWPSGEVGGAAWVRRLVRLAVDTGFRPVLYQFDARADRDVVAPAGVEVVRWDPCAMTLTDLVSSLAACDAIVTARLHGLLIGACLSRPTIGIGLNDKVSHFAQLLSRPCLGAGLTDSDARSTVETAVERFDRDRLDEAVAAQRQVAAAMVDRTVETLVRERPHPQPHGRG